MKVSPLQQIWRDHLLAGAMRSVGGYEDALFVVLYPRDNCHVREAIAAYGKCLLKTDSFAAWTLEEFTDRLRQRKRLDWVDLFMDRYLAWGKIEAELAKRAGLTSAKEVEHA